MNNLNINSAKAVMEVHKTEQENLRLVQDDKKREILRDIKNEEYNQKAIKIAEDCRMLSIVSLIIATIAMIISIFK